VSDMADFAVDFGEPNPVVVPRTYTEAEMREAQAVALEEAADQMREERHGWCLDDAGRYWIKRTLDDLRARAVTVRGGE